MPKQKYWDIRPIAKIPAQYYIIFGERSNGKTYGTLLHCIENYFKTGEQFAYLRRWGDDIKRTKLSDLFSSIVMNGVINDLSDGQWNGIKYTNSKFYLMASDGDGDTITSETPIGYAFAISAMEHNKSISYPNVTNIVFDEFISRTAYIPDEFPLFMNVLSTIIRNRDNVKIWMLGNTVSKECPYFREMGLKHIFQQEPGTIDTYSYTKGKLEMLIAVEYTKNTVSKKSDKYFLFDNPKMQMITGGAWELAIYPHLFEKYKPNQIVFTFFILYQDSILQCEIIEGNAGYFIYIHLKTTELKNPDEDLIYSVVPDSRSNWRTDITRPTFPIEQKICQLIRDDSICFQDNEIGEIYNDYLKWCRQHEIVRR